MCIAANESHLLNIGANLHLGDLRLVMDDGEVLNEFGMAAAEVQGTEIQSFGDGYDSEDYSFEEEEEGVREITWEELVERLSDTDWQPLEDGSSISRTSEEYALFMNRAFGLQKVRATRWLCSDETSNLACLCQEGVFMFSAEFEFGCLIARKRNQALEFMRGGAMCGREGGICGREGPMRAAGQPYDFCGEDECEDGLYEVEFEDEFDVQPEFVDIVSYRGNGVYF